MFGIEFVTTAILSTTWTDICAITPTTNNDENKSGAGIDEVIEIKHTAYSRAVFAKGAVDAAKYLASKETGMYNMADVLN